MENETQACRPRLRRLYRVTYPENSTIYTPVPWGIITQAEMRTLLPGKVRESRRLTARRTSGRNLVEHSRIVELPPSPHIPQPKDPEGYAEAIVIRQDRVIPWYFEITEASRCEHDVVRSNGEVWFGVRLYEIGPKDATDRNHELQEYFLRTDLAEEDEAKALAAITPRSTLWFLTRPGEDVPTYHCWADAYKIRKKLAKLERDRSHTFRRLKRRNQLEERRKRQERNSLHRADANASKWRDSDFAKSWGWLPGAEEEMDIDEDDDDAAAMAPFTPPRHSSPAFYLYGNDNMDVDNEIDKTIGIDYLHRRGEKDPENREEDPDERRTRLVDFYNRQIWTNGLAATMLTLERYNQPLFARFVRPGLELNHNTYPNRPPSCETSMLTVADKLACLAFEENVTWNGDEPWTSDDHRITHEALAAPVPPGKPGPPSSKQAGSYEPHSGASDFLTKIASWTPFQMESNDVEEEQEEEEEHVSRRAGRNKKAEGNKGDDGTYPASEADLLQEGAKGANQAKGVLIVKLYDGRKYTGQSFVNDRTETRLFVWSDRQGPPRDRFLKLAAEVFGDDWVNRMEQQVVMQTLEGEGPVRQTISIKTAPATFRTYMSVGRLRRERERHVFLFPSKWENGDWQGNNVVSMKAFRGGGVSTNPPSKNDKALFPDPTPPPNEREEESEVPTTSGDKSKSKETVPRKKNTPPEGSRPGAGKPGNGKQKPGTPKTPTGKPEKTTPKNPAETAVNKRDPDLARAMAKRDELKKKYGAPKPPEPEEPSGLEVFMRAVHPQIATDEVAVSPRAPTPGDVERLMTENRQLRDIQLLRPSLRRADQDSTIRQDFTAPLQDTAEKTLPLRQAPWSAPIATTAQETHVKKRSMPFRGRYDEP
ncbi:hypothetical protein BC567DRAFT_292919 [Phyllosticta citribraziliensis]